LGELSIPADVLDAVFTAVTAGLAGAGQDVPDSAGISHTKPAITPGCGDQLAVYLDGVSARPYGERRPFSPGDAQRTGILTVLLVRIQLWRCYPGATQDAPIASWDDRDAAARSLLRDMWAVQCELTNRWEANTLIPSFTDGATGANDTNQYDIGIGAATPQTPTGGLAGWQWNLEVGVPTILQDVSDIS